MTAINISASRNPVSGKLQGSYIPVPEGVNFTGTVGHGNTLRITNSAGFPARSNIKPVFVHAGATRFGSNLGRDTLEHFGSLVVESATEISGSLSSSMRWDVRDYASASAGIFTTAVSFNPDKPLIQYIERFYDFDQDSDSARPSRFLIKDSPNYANTKSWGLIINGVSYTHVNDGSPSTSGNTAAVLTSVVALINADVNCKASATIEDVVWLRLTHKVLNDSYPVQILSPGGDPSFTQIINNKVNRYWPTGEAQNSVIVLPETRSYGHIYAENTTVSSGVENKAYYDIEQDFDAWQGETFYFKQSSAAGVADGYVRHFKNAQELNPLTAMATYDNGATTNKKISTAYLNQLALTICYFLPSAYVYTGYMYFDDEYPFVVLADTDNRATWTKEPVPQPAKLWASNYIDITQIGSQVSLTTGCYFLQTAQNTFVKLGRPA